LAKRSRSSLEFMRFCMVGAVNTGVDFAVFAVLSNMGVLLLVAQGISYTCGVLNSFILNRTWTFRGRGQFSIQFIRFSALNLCTLSLTYGLLVYIHHALGWPLLASKVIATGASVVINYAGSRLWIFLPVSSA